MAKKSRMSVLKRQRELRKAEKQALKRERRVQRKEDTDDTTRVATEDDLAGYGFEVEEEETGEGTAG